jgi:hypothetical protein
MEHESSLPCPILSQINPIPLSLRSFIQEICPGPRLLMDLPNKLIFYGEELLATRPIPKLEDHPLSAVSDCFWIYSQLFCAVVQIFQYL